MNIIETIALLMGIFNLITGMAFLIGVSNNTEDFPNQQIIVANMVIGICFINGALLLTMVFR
jgi:Ca2+/H+ antiporter